MRPKDTLGCGEVSSPHDVIDVVIDGGNKKSPGRCLVTPVGAEIGDFGPSRINQAPRRGGQPPGGC
jgi:hypothetical protein